MNFEVCLAAFIPLFFAMDVIGILPLFMNMTESMKISSRRHTINLATITALAVGIIFMFLGKITFHFLGITVPDFKIAGGLLLLIFSVQDLLFSEPSESRSSVQDPKIGVVPIGMPLIVGPGVLATLLLSYDNNGAFPTVVGFVANIAIVWIVFRYGTQIISKIGAGGAIAVGKVFSLLLGAVAVSMIRGGLAEILK